MNVIAQVPHELSWQGQVFLGGRTPQDTTVDMRFTLYPSISAQEPVWFESQNVRVVDGLFSVQLGSANPLPPDITHALFLGVSVSGQPELTRTRLSAVPFALHALNAEKAAALTSNAKGAVLALNGLQGQVAMRAEDGISVRTDERGGLVVGLNQDAKGEEPQSTTWLTAGNNNLAIPILGTRNNQPIPIRTNDIERMRILNTGEATIGRVESGHPTTNQFTVARTILISNLAGAPQSFSDAAHRIEA